MPKLSSVIEQVSGVFKMVKGQDVDINSASDFGANIVDADTILVDDGDLGSQASTKKSTMSRLWTYISGKITSVFLVDEDNMTSNSDVKFPTQQSVKAYVDSKPDLTVDGAGTIHANNVPTLNQDTTGNAATATSATSAGTATSANTAKGLVGGTSQDVIIASEGDVEVRIDNNKKFKIDDDSGTEIFSVEEAGLVEMTSAIISSSGLLQVESGIIRNSSTTSNFVISSSRILNLVHGGSYDIQLGNATNARVLTVRGETKTVIIDDTLELGVSGDTTISRLAAGRVTIEGNEIQTVNKHKHFINFGVNLGYSYSRWIPWGSYYILEQNTDTNPEYTTYVAPHDGKFIKLVIRSEYVLGDTVISLYRVGDGTERPSDTVNGGILVDTKTVGVNSANTTYTYTFDSDATFNSGDAMACKIDPAGNSSISGSPGVTGTFVMEFDLTT